MNTVLSHKILLSIGVVTFIIGYIIGGIYGDALRTVGFILFILGIVAWNKVLRDKKTKEKNK